MMTNKKMDYYKFEKSFNTKRFTLILIFVLILAYGAFNARGLLFGPSIEILHPASIEFETDQDSVIVKGKAINASFISLNERPIYANIAGLFEEELLLSPGANIIKIKARDRFENKTEQTLKIYFKEYEN